MSLGVKEKTMRADLRTDYLGFKLSSPVIAAPSPLTGRIDHLKTLERCGAGAVVLPSLFEEQIDHEELEIQRLLDLGAENSPEVGGYFPELEDYNTGPQSYLRLVKQAKTELTIPVIASLNGSSPGGWARYAHMIEQAGADALELNIYFVATDPNATAEEVENRYLDLVEQVREAIHIPLAVKVGPFFSSAANMAVNLEEAGADALVLFNRFVQPDIDLEEMRVVPQVALSTAAELRLALRWVAILRDRVNAGLAATTGAQEATDIVKLLLAGADTVMVASCLLRHGPAFMKTLVEELDRWLKSNEYESVEQMRGSLSQIHCPEPEVFERANYMKALTSYTNEFV